jgi:hypothetical protein
MNEKDRIFITMWVLMICLAIVGAAYLIGGSY